MTKPKTDNTSMGNPPTGTYFKEDKQGWEQEFDERFTLPNQQPADYTSGTDYNPNQPRKEMDIFLKPSDIKSFIRKVEDQTRQQTLEEVKQLANNLKVNINSDVDTRTMEYKAYLQKKGHNGALTLLHKSLDQLK